MTSEAASQFFNRVESEPRTAKGEVSPLIFPQSTLLEKRIFGLVHGP